jgi:hypothetical protein
MPQANQDFLPARRFFPSSYDCQLPSDARAELDQLRRPRIPDRPPARAPYSRFILLGLVAALLAASLIASLLHPAQPQSGVVRSYADASAHADACSSPADSGSSSAGARKCPAGSTRSAREIAAATSKADPAASPESPWGLQREDAPSNRNPEPTQRC